MRNNIYPSYFSRYFLCFALLWYYILLIVNLFQRILSIPTGHFFSSIILFFDSKCRISLVITWSVERERVTTRKGCILSVLKCNHAFDFFANLFTPQAIKVGLKGFHSKNWHSTHNIKFWGLQETRWNILKSSSEQTQWTPRKIEVREVNWPKGPQSGAKRLKQCRKKSDISSTESPEIGHRKKLKSN